jgi:hypothetical protein
MAATASWQYSIHAPSAYVVAHQSQLLPAWSRPIASVLIALQHCPTALWDRVEASEQAKDCLRAQFLAFGQGLVAASHGPEELIEIFDPRTGLPTRSPAGTLRLDDVAIAQTALGYPTVRRGGCLLLLHPRWGAQVYPSVIMASVSPARLRQWAESAAQPDWGAAC